MQPRPKPFLAEALAMSLSRGKRASRRASIIVFEGGQFLHPAEKFFVPLAFEIKSVRPWFDVDSGNRDIKSFKIDTNLAQGVLDLKDLLPMFNVRPCYAIHFIAHGLAPFIAGSTAYQRGGRPDGIYGMIRRERFRAVKELLGLVLNGLTFIKRPAE
jgi:hypothetical protein